MAIENIPAGGFATNAPVLVIGAGAAGFCAALAANEGGADVVVLERDSLPSGSTALSAGLIPAAGTRFQAERGITDSPALFAEDILRKSHGEMERGQVERIARGAGPTVEWLADRYALPFTVVHDFDYPGHSARRMHGLPSRSGRELIDRLRQAADECAIPVVLNAAVTTLYIDSKQRIGGVAIMRPNGTREQLGCTALILCCSGYGGAPDLVARFVPEMRNAMYFGHPGNCGDAVKWGEALGARLRYMSGYQGHGSVAHPHGVLVTWAVIMEGGFQVNQQGLRFSDESQGYSEQAAIVLAQQGATAFDVFDARIAGIAEQFVDFREAEASGAVISAPTIADLAAKLKIPVDALHRSFTEVENAKASGGTDRFGRSFAGIAPLAPPFKAVKVTGALFHTQGGLAVDAQARVLGRNGSVFPNLFAAGGAAAGVSGSRASGYLSGNGLLTAVVLGRFAGESAARLVKSPQ